MAVRWARMIAAAFAWALALAIPGRGASAAEDNPWEEPLPTLRLRAGGKALPLPLDVASVEAAGGLAAEFSPETKRFSLSAAEELEAGFRFLTVQRAPGEGAEALTLAVEVQGAGGLHEFAYEGEPGLKVFAAGSFNGWSATAWPLEDPEGTGSYSGSYPVEPGKHTYKLVVDGEWIADPANPKKDTGGFGNSLLDAGEAADMDRLFLVQDSYKDLRTAPPSGWLTCLLAAGGNPLSGAEIEFQVLDGDRAISHKFDAEASALRFKVRDIGERAKSFRVFAWGQRPDKSGELRPFRREFRLVVPGFGPWGADWRDTVIYFAMTDRFFDGKPANNAPVDDPELGALSNWLGGDFQGLTQKLEREGYFEQLGVNALWISPVFANAEGAWRDSLPPNEKFTGYHGYWPVSANEIEPRYGGAKALRKLVAAAHRQNKRVLVDFVSNHAHKDHPWFKEHPEWFGTLDLPDGRKNIRLFDEFPFTTWFDEFLASFDYPANPEARRASLESALWLVEEFGIDGFRHDAVKHVPHEYWRELASALRERAENKLGRRFYQVGETISGRGTINEFVGGDMLDAQFDFPLHWAIRDALAFGKGGMDDLLTSLNESLDAYGEDHLMVNFAGNHDFARFMAFASGEVGPEDDEKAIAREQGHGAIQVGDPLAYRKLELAMAFVFTVPGVPMIYYGDEVGLTGAGDPDNRRPMVFGDDLDRYQMLQLAKTKRFGRMRRSNPVFWTGSFLPLAAEDDLLAYLRSDGKAKMIVALNRGSETVERTIGLPGEVSRRMEFQLIYGSPEAKGDGPPPPASLAFPEGSATLTVPPLCALVYYAPNPDPLKTTWAEETTESEPQAEEKPAKD